MEQSTTSRKKVLDDIQKKIAEIENQIQSDCKLLNCGNRQKFSDLAEHFLPFSSISGNDIAFAN